MKRRKDAISAYQKAAQPPSESKEIEADSARKRGRSPEERPSDPDSLSSSPTDQPSSTDHPDGGFFKTDALVAPGSGPKRSAALLLTLGPAQAAEVLRHLDEAEVERLMQEVVALGRLSSDEVAHLIKTGTSDGRVDPPPLAGGPDVAREMLVATFGEAEGERIFFRSIPDAPAHHFAFVNDLEPPQLESVLRDESPAAVALVLAHIDRNLAASVLNSLGDESQAKIVQRIARMGELTRDVVVRVEEALREKVRRQAEAVTELVQGTDTLAAILRHMNPHDGESILSDLRREDVDLESVVRSRLYTVDLLERLSNRDLADVLRDLDDQVITLFLKGKSEDLRATVLRALSDRRAEIVSDEFAHLGPQPRDKVDEATQLVLERVRTLEAEGAILVPREGERYI